MPLAFEGIRLLTQPYTSFMHPSTFHPSTSKRNPASLKIIEKATVGVIYTRPVKKPIFSAEECPPRFNRLRKELERSNSTYRQPLQPSNKLTPQRQGRYDEERVKTKNYARDPITLLPMGKDLLQKTRIVLFEDSTIKSSYNTNNTWMDIRVMNMPCTSLSEMAEGTDKIFAPAAAKTIPLPPILV